MQFSRGFFFFNTGLLCYIAMGIIQFYDIIVREDKRTKFQVQVSNSHPTPVYKMKSLISESIYGTRKKGN